MTAQQEHLFDDHPAVDTPPLAAIRLAESLAKHLRIPYEDALAGLVQAAAKCAHPKPLITITVAGQPAGQGRMMPNQKSKRGMYDASKGLDAWRKTIKTRAEQVMAHHPHIKFPITGPVALSVVWTFTAPKSIHWSRGPCTDRTPDIDHLQRAVFDALGMRYKRRDKGVPKDTPREQQGAGVYEDDAQITHLYEPFGAVYTGHPNALAMPGVVIRVWKLNP